MWLINGQKYIKQLKVFNFNIEKKTLIEPALLQL